VPTDKEQTISLEAMAMNYTHNGTRGQIKNGAPLTVACVSDPTAVTASIDKKAWEGQVVQEAYSRLKEEVADAIRKGEKNKALAQISEYESVNREVNATVGSAVVADNLDGDVQALRQNVERTFQGAPAAVAEQKKHSAKALQYDSYKTRRDKK
jgi:hypothetical protein